MYWTTSGQWPLPDAAEIGNYWGTIEGCVPNELCGFLSSTFTPGTTGGFPDPWQSLRVSERKGRLPVKSEREAILAGLRFHAFECLDRWPTTKPQAKEANRQSSEHSGYRPTASLSWTGAESFTGKIEWAIFSNVEIVAEFRKWVKETRPNEFPNRDKPGKPKDLRAHLRRLAALRLQSRYTVAEIIGGTSLPLKECKVILKAKQFRGETWNNAQQWSDARTEANQEFHRRFRFLPPDERPISWQKYRDTV